MKCRAGSFAWSRRRLLALLSAIAVIRPAQADGAVVEMTKLKFAPEDIEIPVAGEFSDLCKFHRHMTGRIVVR
jgi:hypothetical protein